jgi:putative aldouronate transport system permease protein
VQSIQLTGVINNRNRARSNWSDAVRKHRQLYLMLIPCALLLVVLNYYPLWGIGIAFVDYNPFRGLSGSEFIGLDNFVDVFSRPQIANIVRNTLFIAILKIILGQFAAVLFALMVYEVRFQFYRRLIQTMTTLPYFLSWVVLGGAFVTILASTGPLNTSLETIGLQPIGFLRDQSVFPWTLILTDVWKNFGFGAIIYLAALTQISSELYEAAAVDGAGRWRRLSSVTLPGIMPTIILMAALNLGNVLNAGFEQILVLYNPAVIGTGDVLDTYIFRVGLQGLSYEIATVVGLLKSAVGFVLILTSYWLAARFANYRIL